MVLNAKWQQQSKGGNKFENRVALFVFKAAVTINKMNRMSFSNKARSVQPTFYSIVGVYPINN